MLPFSDARAARHPPLKVPSASGKCPTSAARTTDGQTGRQKEGAGEGATDHTVFADYHWLGSQHPSPNVKIF